MENQNRFDLENAIIAWRNDCASRPGISRDNARELEGHLRESLKDFLKQGLGEPEAFRAAARQLGTPQELAKEFARENPWAVWRERLFWMALAWFAFSVWYWFAWGMVWRLYSDFGSWLHVASGVLHEVLDYLPVLVVAVLLCRGKLEGLQRCVQWCLLSRRRLLLVGAGALFTSWLFQNLGGLTRFSLDRGNLRSEILVLQFFWPVALLGLSVALLSPQPLNEQAKHSSADGPAKPIRLALLGVGSVCIAWPLLAVAASFLFSSSVGLLMPEEIVRSVFWPAFILAVGVMMTLPGVRRGTANPAFAAVGVPGFVWRERIFWAAMGGLAQGLWGIVHALGITVWLGSTDSAPVAETSRLLVLTFYNLLLLLPFLALVLVLWVGAKRGANMSLVLVSRRSTLTVPVLLAAGVWGGLQLWSLMLFCSPPGAVTWRQILSDYTSWMLCLWPLGLAMLVLWTAPHQGHPEEQAALE
jgi:hypothetical protein